MHKNIINICQIVLLVFLSSCREKSPINASIDRSAVSGIYDYKGYDLDNNEIVSGTFQVQETWGVITGCRNLMRLDTTKIAFESGNGELSGSIDTSGNIRLFTENQEYVLAGRFSEGMMSGSRLFSGTTVPPTTIIFGSFVAVKVKNHEAFF